MNVIECRDVTVRLQDRVVLEKISLEVAERQLVIVFGPNGAGKTTFLRVLLGQLRLSAGEVKVLGRNPRDYPAQIGYVPQGVFARSSFPITVLKTVMMGRQRQIGICRRPRKADYEVCRQALADVGLGDYENTCLGDLSGGQRQRVFLARALAGEPKILLLDEATSGVDIGAKETLYDLLLRLKHIMTVIFVTHDVGVVSKDVDQIICLNRTLVSHGRPAEALTEEVLRCMYGDRAALFSHCATPHVHVEGHE